MKRPEDVPRARLAPATARLREAQRQGEACAGAFFDRGGAAAGLAPYRDLQNLVDVFDEVDF